MGLETGIWPRDWNLGLETGIWAKRVGFGPEGRGGTEEKKEEEEEKEKFPLCESIGHRPLRGRCPKTNMSVLAHQKKY